jgi:hypothetical protein
MNQSLNAITREIDKVKPGDPVLAEQWNRVATAIKQLVSTLALQTSDHRRSEIFVGELQGNVEADDTDKAANLMSLDVDNGSWEDLGVEYDSVYEPQGGCWLEGERLPLLHERSSGKLHILPMVQVLYGKLDNELTEEGSATMSVWEVDGSGDYVDTGSDVTVWDWCLSTGQTIAEGKKVIAAQFLQSRRFIVVAAECV